ncbi:MAG: polysaccharide pyruvyl transferase family protein [Candidatus Omnitrophica bacterium]|nr:polysaccharide pyruvyl transferase family protein [Candidatus Omnitrophota bacterium]
MKNIFLTNLASPANPGDQAILMGSLKLLRLLYESPRITLATRAISQKQVYEELGCAVVPQYPNVEYLGTDSYLKKIAKVPKAFSQYRPMREAVQNADILFLVGGGYFYSYKKGLPGLTFLSHCTPVALAHYRKKPVVLLPQSYGPFKSALSSWMMDLVVRESALLFYREDLSGNWLRERYGKFCDKIIYMPDLAFMLEASDFGVNEISDKQKCHRIGITVRPWKDAATNEDRYLRVLADALIKLYRRTGMKIRIIVQVVRPTKTESDEWSSRKLDELLSKEIPPDALEFCMVKPFYRLSEIMALYGQCDFLIGMRLHSAILSFIVGRPALVTGYQHKAKGVLKTMGLEELYLGDYDAITSESLTHACEAMIKNQEKWSRRIKEAVRTKRGEIWTIFPEKMERFR